MKKKKPNGNAMKIQYRPVNTCQRQAYSIIAKQIVKKYLHLALQIS